MLLSLMLFSARVIHLHGPLRNCLGCLKSPGRSKDALAKDFILIKNKIFAPVSLEAKTGNKRWLNTSGIIVDFLTIILIGLIFPFAYPSIRIQADAFSPSSVFSLLLLDAVEKLLLYTGRRILAAAVFLFLLLLEEEEEEVEGRRDKVGLFIVSRKVFTFFCWRGISVKRGKKQSLSVNAIWLILMSDFKKCCTHSSIAKSFVSGVGEKDEATVKDGFFALVKKVWRLM
ncbi:ORF891 [White spot syndrome virus]|uniref:Wsv418 n=3 Tax=White spot syndrome virus TaxID=342409 RepID=Q8VAJ1_WSSVS|nr:wsv418 [Shrimp white spot syndrome virus]ATU83452.1 ORF891 [White spot syndrome virus]AAL33420.1 wsv418 [Shrimp white spot syndrome virus]AAL89345.1 WSSV477 [Shrimp white spot syndrome virus]AWQ60542.1 wsv418 [Shrimp white spot syndrome virus]AWQ61844.1 wsv418 [Shrimp white spot syndrome virus]